MQPLSKFEENAVTLHGNADSGAQPAHRTVAERDLATMRARDVARDREAQASAAFVLVAGIVEPEERLEHLLAHRSRNARTVVIDGDGQIAMIAMAGDGNGVGMPRRVGDEIG